MKVSSKHDWTRSSRQHMKGREDKGNNSTATARGLLDETADEITR